MKNIFLFVILVFSSDMIAQQVYGIQRGQRGYIPPPKYEASRIRLIRIGISKNKSVEF